MYEELLGL